MEITSSTINNKTQTRGYKMHIITYLLSMKILIGGITRALL